MNDTYIVTGFVVIDDLLILMNHQDDSQLEKMGLQRLHARTNEGFTLKVLASLVALTFTNAN